MRAPRSRRQAGISRTAVAAWSAVAVAALPAVGAAEAGGERAAIRFSTSGECPSPNPPNQLTLVAGTPQTTPLSTPFASSLQVALTNGDGCAVTGAAGAPVTFSAPAAGPSGHFAASNANTVTVGADASGQVSAPALVANGQAGSYAVIASSTYGSVPFSLTNTADGIPARVIAISGAAEARVTTRFAEPLRVRVIDASGGPVTGVPVTFTLGSGGAGRCAGTAVPVASFAGGGTQATASTDAAGLATSPALLAGSAAGAFTAIASVSGGAEGAGAEGAGDAVASTPALRPVDFDLADLAGEPRTITPGVGARQATAVGSVFPLRLAVTVTDAQSNPVPGAFVTFSAPAFGAGGRFIVRSHDSHRRRARVSRLRTVRVRTGSCGIAVAPRFAAGRDPGGYVVKADAGPARPAGFALVNEAR